MAPRLLDDHEFVWMLRGEARVVTADAELPLRPGQLLLVPPGVRHGFAWDHRRPSRHGYVHFQPAAPAARGMVLRRMTGQDPLAGLCAYLLWLAGETVAGWEEAAGRTVGQLLNLVTSGPLPGDADRRPLPAPLAAAVVHLRRTWSAPPLRRMSLDELAAAAAVSRGYLNRLFRSEFGVSAAAGLERLRCSRAETLLARTDLPVGAVAEACGFADLYHFSHRFTRLYGLPPTAYRAAGGPGATALDHPGVRRLAHAVWS
jgi:AraC-like DNA-binding protein